MVTLLWGLHRGYIGNIMEIFSYINYQCFLFRGLEFQGLGKFAP